MRRDLKVIGLQSELEKLGSAQVARFLQGFFKTGAGEYGAGDRFRGIRVPMLRRLARRHGDLSLAQIALVLRSPFHEDRLLALLLLVRLYEKGDAEGREKIYDLYLDNTRFINNWDLVDASAAQIVGAFLTNRDRHALDTLAWSSALWERRIAIMATFCFIKCGEFSDALRLAEKLLSEDLIHKAVGWMLREIGKRSLQTERNFLQRHGRQMPRTMLRYAIEKFSDAERRKYLKGDGLNVRRAN